MKLPVMATVLVVAFAAPSPADAAPQDPAALRRAMQVLEDVCDVVSCDKSRLRSAERPIDRVARLREAAGPRASLADIYTALEAPRQTGATISDDARALQDVRDILTADCPTCQPAGPATLGIPQKEMPDPHPYLLERSMLFPFQQGLILEAQVAPHLYVWETLTKKEGVQLHGGNAFALSITPMFKVRIRNEKSSPVQTLSFMPKINVQYFRLPRRQPESAPDGTPNRESDPWPSTTWMKGGLFVWGHHSNGQTECLYQGPDRDVECAPPTRVEDVRINFPTGSFSTNYLRFAVFTTRLHIPTKIQPMGGPMFQQVADRKTTFAATLEVNPPNLPPGGDLKEPARSLYGPTRWGVLVEHERRLAGGRIVNGSVRFTGSAEHFNKVANIGSSSVRWVAEAAWEPDWFRSGGFVARYVHGQDYYNLQFDRNIHWFQVGIVFSASEFEPFLIRRSR